MASDDAARTERRLHEAFWASSTQHALRDAERAIGDARGLIYAMLSHLDNPEDSPFKPETLRTLSDQWLEDHGRDEKKEAEASGSRS